MGLETTVIKCKDGQTGSEVNVAREKEDSAQQNHSDDFKMKQEMRLKEPGKWVSTQYLHRAMQHAHAYVMLTLGSTEPSRQSLLDTPMCTDLSVCVVLHTRMHAHSSTQR